jgi:hypothetical protein
MQAIQALAGGRERRTDRQLNVGSQKVPTVVPDIPVIHRLITENFASATRRTRAWSSSDRGGRPSLSQKAGNGQTGEEGTEEPISAGRQWKELSGSIRGQPGRGAGRVFLLKRDAAPRFFGILVSEAGRERGRPKKGRGKSNGFERRLRSSNWPDIERQANLREAQSGRSQASLRRERFDRKRRLSW